MSIARTGTRRSRRCRGRTCGGSRARSSARPSRGRAEQSPFHRRRLEAAKVKPGKIRRFDDLRRLPFTTRDEWMDCQAEKPALRRHAGARPSSAAIRYHMTCGHDGPHAAARARRPRPTGSGSPSAGATASTAFGVRPERPRVLRVLLRHVHRLLGRPLRLREDGLPRAAVGQHDDAEPRAADRRDGRDGRLRDADLRAAPGAGGARDGHRPARAARSSA